MDESIIIKESNLIKMMRFLWSKGVSVEVSVFTDLRNPIFHISMNDNMYISVNSPDDFLYNYIKDNFGVTYD